MMGETKNKIKQSDAVITYKKQRNVKIALVQMYASFLGKTVGAKAVGEPERRQQNGDL